MRELFSPDSPLMRFLGRVGDLMILNIIFVITCIPIVTIGPALTALHYVTLKMAEQGDVEVVRSYFRSFRQNFRQALIIWLIMLLFAWILWFDIANLWGANDAIHRIVLALSFVALVCYVLVLLYVFPVLAQFDNTIAKTFRNAVGISLRAFPRTVSMFMLILASVMLTFYTVDTFKYCSILWLTLGFSSIAYANSFLLRKTFAKYIDKPDEAEED